MTYTHTSLGIGLSFLLLFGCSKPAADSETSSLDSLATDSVAFVPDDVSDADAYDETTTEPDVMENVVSYYNAIDTEEETTLATFVPLEKVLALAQASIHFKDSIEYARQTLDLTDPADSALFMPRVNKAYEAIMEYQSAMRSGIKVTDKIPKLTDVVRTTNEGDRSSEFLPEAGASNALSHGNFLFMGGAPFFRKVVQEENGVFESPEGFAESRYEISLTDNSNFLFNSIYHRQGGEIDVTFGPPLNSYESGPQEVNGIGSLIHTFKKRVSVWLLTEDGALSARLISVRFKIVPEGLGCMSDEPLYTFASPTDIDANEILAVYIPYFGKAMAQHGPMSVNRISGGVWTADVTGDGIADFACVEGHHTGEASGENLSQVLWFVNINGEWKIIDAGTDKDCT